MGRTPTEEEWEKLLKDIPVETIELDENGNYNPEKHPDFHDWVVNG